MTILLGLSIGLREIWSHKFRSFLTMLGIILGVASLLSMFSLVAGIANGMRTHLAATGGLERVNIGQKDPSEQFQDIAFISPGRTMDDVEAIRRGAPLIDLVTGESNNFSALSRGGITTRSQVVGGLPGFSVMGRYEMEYGRMITDLDVENAHKVVVLGASMVEELWPGTSNYNPVGERILINGSPFVVIGTFPMFETDAQKRQRELGLAAAQAERRARRGQAAPRPTRRRDPFSYKNRTALIPISTMMQEFKSAKVDANRVDAGPNFKLDLISVRVADLSRFDEAISQVRRVLEITHRGIDDFSFETREDWFDGIERSISATRASGGLIAGISLIVGGIGITNIMLASISERIREIGVRLAIGAKRRDIFVQFLVESTVVGVIGGCLGLFAASFLTKILIIVSPTENAPVIELSSVLWSFAAAVAIGIGSGLYPAWRAARLSPLEALRYQ